MLFPFRTDAPIYHWPVVTTGLIVANVAIFTAYATGDAEWVMPLLMEFGDGLHPYQWFTNIFLHADAWHLISNMVWLFAFGLIVEGKLGWWKFLLVYLGIGVAESAIAQIIMLGGSESYALGASGAIFGLMSISLLWAPKNEVGCVVLFFGIIPRVYEVSVMVLSGGYLLLQFVFFALSGFGMSSALLHLLGGVIGLGVGYALLVTKRVDCEGWDLFSVWKGEHIKLPSQIPEYSDRRDRPTDEGDGGPQKLSQEAAHAQIRDVLSAGQPLLALAAHRKLSQSEPGWLLPRELHLKLTSDLCGRSEWDHAVKLMQEYLELHQQQAPLVRLKLAEVLLKQFERPSAALKVLARIPPGALNERQEQFRSRIAARAEQMRQEGVIELESEEF